MPWALVAWLLSFFLQSVLVGVVFYTLIQLYDFEEDLLNNSDCARRCNMWAAPELGIQLAILAISLVSGHVAASLLSAVGAGLLIHRHVRGKHLLDPVELWKQLPQARKYTYYKMAAFAASFVFITFRMIEVIVHEVLSDHGRHLLKHVLKDAMMDPVHLHR